MPSKSPAQAKLMRAVAHGWKPDQMKGPSRKVAKEFVSADKKAKGYGAGGSAKKMFKKVSRKVLKAAQRGDKGAEAFIRKYASKYERGELDEKSWIGKWMLEQRGQFDPRPGGGLAAATQPERTIQPIEGREFISGDAPPRQFAAAPPRRAAADVAPGFNPGRVPPALAQYLQSLQGGAPQEPVKMQLGGAMNFLFKGRGPQQAMQQMKQRGQPPGGGMTSDQGMQKFLRRGQVPGGGGGGGGQLGRTMRDALQQVQRRGQPPGGAQPGEPPPMKGIGRAPGAGVPLRGVGRPPGMGRPGAGGGAGGSQGITFGEGDPSGGGFGGGSNRMGQNLRGLMQQMRKQRTGAGGPQRQIQPIGGGYNTGVAGGSQLLQPSGGAGMPGGANRIGMGDQQGAQARAMQVQTGRPPISRRQPFPGGPGGGLGRRRGRGFGRAR